MSNLLEKASILLTPTAYDDGKILSVKPEEVLGEELVTNGDFATDSDWSKDAGWTISNGTAICNGLGVNSLQQSGITTVGKVYKLTFDVLDSNNFNFLVISANFGDTYVDADLNNAVVLGKNTFYIKPANGTGIRFRVSNGTTLSIDNVSVKEAIDGDFDFTRNSSATRVNSQGLIEDVQILSSNLVSNGDFSQEGSELITNGDFANNIDGWISYSSTSAWDNGTIKTTATSNAAWIRQNSAVTSNKSYKVTFKAKSSNISPNIKIYNGATFLDTGLSFDAIDTYKEFTYYLYTTASNIIIGQQGLSVGDTINFDNVSVKEVGQDWNLGTGWSIGTNKALANNVPNLQRLQRAGNNPSVIGNTYKYSINISNVSGFYSVYIFGVYVLATSNTEGIIEGEFTATSTNGAFWVAGASASGLISATIENITILEITEDTNLPRINYEGFSYQDALGSELITNGDFATDLSGWLVTDGAAGIEITWTANGVSFITDGAGGGIQQSVMTVGKSYLIEFDYTAVSGAIKMLPYFTDISETKRYSGYFVATTANIAFYRKVGGTEGIIDNVSVKEVLGQEVVPDSGCGSWLFEPQSTNLIITSDSGVYGSSPASEILTTAPDGTNTAVRPVPNTGSNRYTGQISGGTYATNTKITYSWYRKRISTPVIDTYVGDLHPNILVNVTQVGSTIQVKSDINGFDRFSATFNISDGSLASNIRLYFGAIIGTGNSSVAYWGHQLEVGSYATSIIPTNGSTVTRLQDAAFGAGSSDLINSTEGVLYAEIAALANDLTNKQISLNNGTTDDRIQLYYSASSNQISVFYKSQSGATAFILNHTLSDITQFNKVAFKWKQNDFALWSNSVEVATQTSGVTSIADTLTKLDFQQFNGSADFFGKTKCLAVFKEALTDAELTCLTTT